MLYTKCILKPPCPEDGFRISVMSRHTRNDGKTPDTRITEELFHTHLPELGPDPKKLGQYLRKEITWEEFDLAYKQRLESEPASTRLVNLAEAAIKSDFTLLCIEETAENCHRRILAEECKRRFPHLQIEHR